jgi:hypothetical protein
LTLSASPGVPGLHHKLINRIFLPSYNFWISSVFELEGDKI